MSDVLYFSRDTKVYLTIGDTVWEIPVLDGFSFSQATNASEITLNEMAGTNSKSRRSRQMFTDSYAPAEWSFNTYMRPFVAVDGATNGWEDTGAPDNHHAVEEALWACLAGKPSFTASSGSTAAAWSSAITNSTSNMIVDFTDSERTDLQTFTLTFVMGNSPNQTIYEISNCCVNEASIDFDIDGIAQIAWSGFGSLISEVDSVPTVDISEGVSSTSNFIRNRLTTLGVTGDGSTFSNSYSLVLTGGNITISNNITYLTPETLGIVNQPIGHVTGTRNVGGSFTCYLNAATDSSADLFEDIIEARDIVTNNFGLTFGIGGGSAPNVSIAMPACHLEVPTHSIDDVVSLETTFHALPSSIDPTQSGNDADDMEIKVTYTGG